MKILFHENQLSYRGTSVALYDYADFNEKILGNKSIITYDLNNPNNSFDAINNFKKRFNVLGYSNKEELYEIAKKEQVDALYAIKSGENDGVIIPGIKNCIHVVFKVCEPHGDVYSYVSEWLANNVSQREQSFVPHIIKVVETSENLRKELMIPESSKVFGYYGGNNSFDIKFVKKTIIKIARNNPNIFFIFMGVDNFYKRKFLIGKKIKLPNIIFLESSVDQLYKSKFINTCDAMLHARLRGETFGMAIGEFAIKGKTIITYKNSKERNHIDILGSDAYYYENSTDLIEIIFNKKLDKSSKESYLKFSPENVMKKFTEVFLEKNNTF